MNSPLPSRVAINAPMHPRIDEILTADPLALFAKQHSAYDARRPQLLKARVERQSRIDSGQMPDFLAETRAVRDGDWKIAPAAKALECRRVEITGPTSNAR